MRSRCMLAPVLGALLSLAAARPAEARLDLRQQYEEELVRWALGEARLEREREPRGKVIDRVVIVRENVIARSDPWPNLVNWFHAKTRDAIVRQELLVAPGQPWDEELVEESARNLRKLFILAVVRVVPCRAPRPGRVVLLVITKDLWSIRLNTNWSMVGSLVQFVDFNPTEMNFLGRNKRIGLHVGLQQMDLGAFKVRDVIEVGQLYVDERLLGSRWRFIEWFDAVIAGDVAGAVAPGQRWKPTSRPGQLEGAYVQLRATRPLFSLATRWGFDVWAVANVRQARTYTVNKAIAPNDGELGGLSLKTVAFQSPTGELSYVPRVCDVQEISTLATITRSFGQSIKWDLSAALGGYRLSYAAPGSFGELFDAATVARYERLFLPRSEDAVFAHPSLAAGSRADRP